MSANDHILDGAAPGEPKKVSLNPQGPPPGEDKLFAYLEGRLSPDELHHVERWLAEVGMEADALEGLQTLKPAEARGAIQKLNHDLDRKLKSRRKHKRQSKPDQVILIAVVIILLLSVVAYVVLRYAAHK